MSAIKNDRITARVNDEVKNTLSTAAELVGATLNQFLVQAALEKAEAIIEKERVIYLGKRDSELFFDALNNPPEPNQKLKKALANYRLKIG